MVTDYYDDNRELMAAGETAIMLLMMSEATKDKANMIQVILNSGVAERTIVSEKEPRKEFPRFSEAELCSAMMVMVPSGTCYK